MKRFAWLVTAGVLAAGSIAVAQPGFIVDPWGASAPLANPRRADVRVTQRSYHSRDSSDVIVDPWSSALGVLRPSAISTASKASARSHDWPRAAEIVDPWASSERRRTSARFDALIVDPWAR